MSFFWTNAARVCLPEDAGERMKLAASLLRGDMEKTLLPAEVGEAGRICYRWDKTLLPEQYLIKIMAEGIDLFAADDLGFFYGTFYLSEHILGVPPFWFWADLSAARRSGAAVPEGEIRSRPAAVRYRGWFINDEVLLLGWHDSIFSPKTWEPVFEALLRCGGNTVIPGTGKTSLGTRSMVQKYGLYLAHHHAEPLDAEMFSSVYPDRQPSYTRYPQLFEKLWQRAIDAQKGMKVIWSLGFRGQGDHAFWEEDAAYDTPQKRGKLISQIIRRQYDMVRAAVPDAVLATNLYGEILTLYRQGNITLPPDVIRIWADSGYGKMVSRRQGNDDPRVPSLPGPQDGRHNGAYYHVTFHDLQASNHLTMLPNSAAFVYEELQALFHAGGTDLLLINCGNIRPHLYLLDLCRTLWQNGDADVEAHRQAFCNVYCAGAPVQAAAVLKEFGKTPVQYGPYPDARAGEQFYHYPPRFLANRLIRGDWEQGEEMLWWVTGHCSLQKQAEQLQVLYRRRLPAWRALEQHCAAVQTALAPDRRQFFADGEALQVFLCRAGCEAADEVCGAVLDFLDGKQWQAFCAASRAMALYNSCVERVRGAEHGKWEHFYRNECITGLRLSVYSMDVLRKYIRAVGDGPNYGGWERTYAEDPADARITLLSTRAPQRSDDELFRDARGTEDSQSNVSEQSAGKSN
jgi:hypothetical protein